jgi:GxxExxY protein
VASQENGREKAQEVRPKTSIRADIMHDETQIRKLCDLVRETAFAIHKYFRSGHLEKVYENALVHRLRKTGLQVEQQWPLPVFDEDGTPVGDYFADLIIEGWLVVELKAARCIADEHVAQILGYLRASRQEHGLLINFGAKSLYIKKFVLSDERFF